MPEDLLIDTLNKLNYPVFLQGSLSEKEFPNDFFTFLETSSESNSFYDNKETYIVHRYNLFFYSVNPENVYTVMRDAILLLKKSGFIVSGNGQSVLSGVLTHDGRKTTVIFLENVKLK